MRAATLLLYAIAAGCLLVVTVQWAMTLRIYRNIPLILIERMIGIALRTARRSLYAATLVVLVAPFAADLLFGSFPLPLGFVFAVAVVPLGHASLPPTVLLLAASRPEIEPLVREVKRFISVLGIVRLRVSHLLDGLPGSDRATPALKWQALVAELMDVVPLIVVDTRVATPPVVDETILALQYPDKALFIVNADRSSAVFSLLSERVHWSGCRAGIPPAVRVVTGEEVPSAARNALRAAVSRDPARFDKYRGAFTPGPGPLLHYQDDRLPYSFVLPAGWVLWRKLDPVGCVAISSEGSLAVSVDAVEDSLTNRTRRKAALLDSARERGFARIDLVADGRTFAGEENAILYCCETPAGRKRTGIDVVRHAVRYRIDAEALPGRSVDEAMHALEVSFQFARPGRTMEDRS